MKNIFLGKPSHWLLLAITGAVLYAMGSQHLHVRAFPVFFLLILTLAVAALAWIVWGYRPGDAITRESFDQDELPSQKLGEGE